MRERGDSSGNSVVYLQHWPNHREESPLSRARGRGRGRGQPMIEIVVIGGGIIGASVAYRLTQAGARVTLLEAGHLVGGTSGASFAWLNANNKPPLAYHILNTGGMAEHRILAAEFGSAPWLHLDGNIEWAAGEADHAALLE